MQNVRLYGKKPYQLAVVHGGPGALGAVAAIARELSKSFGVIEPLQTKYTISELLQELNSVLDQTAKEPITLIGHSWGAWLVFMFAAKYPDKVKKIILVGSGPFEKEYVSKIGKNRLSRLPENEQIEFRSIIKQLDDPKTPNKNMLLPRLGQLANKADNYEVFKDESVDRDSLPFDGDMYHAIWNEAANLREQGELIKLAEDIRCPVIAIHGEFDPHPIEGVKTPLEKYIKDFKLYKLEKCGHIPWKEVYAHKDFYEIIKKDI